MVNYWLVVYLPSEKYWSIGMILTSIWKIKVMFQTTNQIRYELSHSSLHSVARSRRPAWLWLVADAPGDFPKDHDQGTWMGDQRYLDLQ